MHRPGDHEPQIFVFLLVPGLSMMSLASALEPLRSLNRLAGRDAYAWRLASLDGAPVAASNGIAIAAMRSDAAMVGADYLFVCGGLRIQSPDERRYLAVLRQAARSGIAVGSLSTGTYLLARAGLLLGYRCTIHWENRPAFREAFPDLRCTSKIYEIDRDRLTCSGGTASMDLMLHLIADRHGIDLARSVANQFHTTASAMSATTSAADASKAWPGFPRNFAPRSASCNGGSKTRCPYRRSPTRSG
jgi:transcriptional regulator GlxA family with amidase domain